MHSNSVGGMDLSGRRGLLPALKVLALPIVLPMVLSACASPGGRTAYVPNPAPSGPRVAGSANYRSSTLRPYSVHGQTYYPEIPNAGYSETGIASWYGEESGTMTANGEHFDADALSAAHKTFPLPSIVEVTNLDNGRVIRLRVNDRGPFNDRIIDLSRGAAKALGVYQAGTAHVRVTWLGPADSTVATPVYAAPAAARDDDDDSQSYIVQLGAFSQKDNALTAQSQMDDARLDQQGDLYIVYLGPYQSAASAENHRQDAIDNGFRDAIVRKRD